MPRVTASGNMTTYRRSNDSRGRRRLDARRRGDLPVA
jgi:hypothetical protein